MTTPLIISFYTPDSIYEKEIEDLKASCEKLNLPYHFEKRVCKGKWVVNVNEKPKFILEKLKEFKRPIIWVDADAIIVQRPSFFRNLDCDFAVRIDPKQDDQFHSKVIAATCYARYSDAAIKLLERWIERCEEGKETGGRPALDQEYLRDIIHNESYQAKIESLPLGYCRVIDSEEDQIPDQDTYILQFQASRLGQKILDGEILPFFNCNDMTGMEIKKLHAKF